MTYMYLQHVHVPASRLWRFQFQSFSFSFSSSSSFSFISFSFICSLACWREPREREACHVHGSWPLIDAFIAHWLVGHSSPSPPQCVSMPMCMNHDGMYAYVTCQYMYCASTQLHHSRPHPQHPRRLFLAPQAPSPHRHRSADHRIQPLFLLARLQARSSPWRSRAVRTL